MAKTLEEIDQEIASERLKKEKDAVKLPLLKVSSHLANATVFVQEEDGKSLIVFSGDKDRRNKAGRALSEPPLSMNIQSGTASVQMGGRSAKEFPYLLVDISLTKLLEQMQSFDIKLPVTIAVTDNNFQSPVSFIQNYYAQGNDHGAGKPDRLNRQ